MPEDTSTLRHRSGGHFDVEFNQQPSRQHLRRYRVTNQGTRPMIQPKKVLVGLQTIGTTRRVTIPGEIIVTQNKREHCLQLTLALHYVNKP